MDASQEKHREPTEVNITPEMLKEGGSGFPEPWWAKGTYSHDAPWCAMKASKFVGVLKVPLTSTCYIQEMRVKICARK